MLETLHDLAYRRLKDQPDRLVAFSPQGRVTWRDLAEDVAQWRQQLDLLPETCVLIQQSRGDNLLACLLACWQIGKTPVLTTGANDLFAERLADIGDKQDYALGVTLPPTTSDSVPALVLYTSGSSGTPTAIAKTFAQLDAELALLEHCWGEQLGDSVLTAMVSRHHMFGLPFGLLWPAVRGSAFYTETVHYNQSLETLAQRFDIALIASPVQLANLPDNLDWQPLQRRVRIIFSAGAPLPEAAARHCQQVLIPVTEIYGSTETGAIAWRRQLADTAWQPLPGINIDVDSATQQLRVNGATISTDPANWLAMADTARLLAGAQRFELLGRIDRIAKVGGKRISLTDVENRLQTHPWVAAVRVVHLPERKDRLGAVVVLAGAGRAALIDRGRQEMNRQLAHHLDGLVEPVAVPRYWRYVHRLPHNAQGKTPGDLLKVLFNDQAQPRFPEVLEESLTTEGQQSSARFVLRVPDTLYYFSGHFPGQGVVPGVVQITWVQHFSALKFGELGTFLRLENLKFHNLIQPGDNVVLELHWQPEKGRLQFRYASASKDHASGRILFQPEAESANAP